MKTNLIAPPPAQHVPPRETTVTPRLSAFAGFLMAAICAVLVSFVTTPVALAGGPDGEYQLTSATGTITLAGQTQELPQEIVQQLSALQSGGIVVKNSQIKLDRKMLVRLINKLADQFGATVDYKLSGPTSLKLNKHGKVYSGSTSKPVAVTFDISIPDVDQAIKGNLKSDFEAKVKGKVLTLHVPVTGKIVGKKVSADLTITCTR